MGPQLPHEPELQLPALECADPELFAESGADLAFVVDSEWQPPPQQLFSLSSKWSLPIPFTSIGTSDIPACAAMRATSFRTDFSSAVKGSGKHLLSGSTKGRLPISRPSRWYKAPIFRTSRLVVLSGGKFMGPDILRCFKCLPSVNLKATPQRNARPATRPRLSDIPSQISKSWQCLPWLLACRQAAYNRRPEPAAVIKEERFSSL
jgi:hypothetical protein